MTQDYQRMWMGFTLFGALIGAIISAAGFWLWIVIQAAGMIIGVIFFGLGRLVLARANQTEFSPVLGLGMGVLIGAFVGAMIGLVGKSVGLGIAIPVGAGGAMIGALLSALAWAVIGFAFGSLNPQAQFYPRFAFAIGTLWGWIIGFGGAVFYPLISATLDATGLSAVTGAIAGTFLGAAIVNEAQRRFKRKPAKR